MSQAWAKGSTRQWRRTRAWVLRRDRYYCQLRYPDTCTAIATEVHHTLGKGISEELDHLVAVCHNCNTKAGNPRTTNPPPQPRTQW